MTAPVFHLDPLPAGTRLTLAGTEGRHAARVRRLRPGEAVDVTDGQGRTAHCQVSTAARDQLELTVMSRSEVPRPAPRLVVVQALIKGDRGELAMEMLTEVGVDEIVPWAATRCVVRWEGERGRRGVERWRSAAREAAKQARRSWWPPVGELATTAQVAERLAAADCSIVLHESAATPLSALPAHDAQSAGEIVVVVGPEGGIEEQELAALAAQAYRLGDTVLRASTAGPAAAAVLLAKAGRW